MHQHDHTEDRRGLRARLRGSSVRTRSVLAATGVLVVGISATGVAATGSAILEGKRNGTATQETQVIADIGATNSATGGYSTRQSNLSSTGGGAVYGCRSTAGGSAAPSPTNPCIRANNLSSGYAFEFNASDGLSAGVITVGNGGDAAKPFTTNATGVATGLNADRVDGINGTDLVTKTDKVDADKLDGKDSTEFAAAGDLLFAAVTSAGNVAAARGGTATASVTGTTFTVTFPKDVSKCSFTATPNGATATPGLSLAVASAGANKVTVDEAATPAITTPVPFHLQVIC